MRKTIKTNVGVLQTSNKNKRLRKKNKTSLHPARKGTRIWRIVGQWEWICGGESGVLHTQICTQLSWIWRAHDEIFTDCVLSYWTWGASKPLPLSPVGCLVTKNQVRHFTYLMREYHMYLPSINRDGLLSFYLFIYFDRNTFYSRTDHSAVILISRYCQGCGTKCWALGVKPFNWPPC